MKTPLTFTEILAIAKEKINYTFDCDFVATGEDNDYNHAQKVPIYIQKIFSERMIPAFSNYEINRSIYVSTTAMYYLRKLRWFPKLDNSNNIEIYHVSNLRIASVIGNEKETGIIVGIIKSIENPPYEEEVEDVFLLRLINIT